MPPQGHVLGLVMAALAALSVHAEAAVPAGVAKVDAVLDLRKRPLSWSERFEANAR